jgi:outer membrane lipoprotein-sorting protein
MRRLVYPLLAIVVAAANVGTPVHALTARELLDQANNLDDTTRTWADRAEKMTLHIHAKRGGERVRELRIYNKRHPNDEDKSISFFLAPAEVKGTAFLQWTHKSRDDDQWLYLPELKRTRQITARARDESFMGTDFTYRDLEIMGKILNWTEDDAPTKLVGEEPVGGATCHVIELLPKQEGMTYGKLMLWMDKDKLVPRKLEFYDREGERVKRLTMDDVRDIGAIPTAHRLEMENVKSGSRTVVERTDVAYDAGLKDDLFTQRQLERGAP